jgi:hypothetical protein
MTNKEKIERNIGLTFDFVNYLIDHPNATDNLPQQFKIEFLEKDFPNIQKVEEQSPELFQGKMTVRVRNSFEIS